MDDSISLFETITLTHTVDTLFTPKTFLVDSVTKDSVTVETEFFQVDNERNERDLAPIQHRGKEAKQVDSGGFKSKKLDGFNVRLKIITTAYKILQRAKGQIAYMAKSPATKAREKLARDLLYMRLMVVRLEEWLMAQFLQYGKVSIDTIDYQGELDLKMKDSHKVTLSGGDRWSQAGSNPLADVDKWRDTTEKDSGKVVDWICMDSHAARLFRDNDKVQKVLDNRKILNGEIVQKRLPSGARYMGTIDEIDYYQYSEWVKDAKTGANVPLLDNGRVLLYSSQCMGTRYYGAVDDLEFDGYAGDFKMFSKSWLDPDPSGMNVLLAANILPYIHEIDGVFSVLCDGENA